MSPLVKKEVRLLMPGFLAAMVLAFSNFLLPDFGRSPFIRGLLVVFPFVGCPAMVLMMALSSFGSELSFGTFSNLLAQPVPRKQIWRVKIFLLAGALFILGSIWCVFFYLRYAPFRDPNNPQDYWDVFVCAWTFLLVVFSGALWTVLLIRQVAAAFWFTILTPALILVLTAGLNSVMADAPAEWIRVTLLCGYSVAGLWFARWLFLRAQDAQWTGGTIALPEMRGLSHWFSNAAATRRWRPRVALWRKELQLHQSQLIIAGVLAFLHLVVVFTRKYGQFQRNSATEFVLETFWLLWMVMPVLVGCAAMAEERKMATLESQLCLPVKRGAQFRIKFLVVLMFSVALGTVMPWLLEGNRILPDFNLQDAFNSIMGGGNNGHLGGYICFPGTWAGVALQLVLTLLIPLSQFIPFLFMAAICAGVAAIAFYGSSLARNTLQGLAPSVLGLFVVSFLGLVASRPHEFGLGFLWRGPMFYVIAAPVMIAVVMSLAFRNCQQMRITGVVWLKNLLTLVAALALVISATSAIYHRAWELLSANEPAHGPARWTTAHPPRMQITGQTVTIYLPDGRVWMNRYDQYSPNPLESTIVEDRMFGGGKFLAGTNWTDVRDYWRDIVGVQRDGSLWVSKMPIQIENQPAPGTTELALFGDGHDWKNVAGHYLRPILLKRDGTLWSWGTNGWPWNKKWPGLHAFTPQRLGTDSDWEKVFNSNGSTFLIKTNGQVWVEPAFATAGDQETEIKTFVPFSITIGRAPYLESRTWIDVGSYLCAGFTILLGVFEDGTFREVASYDWISTPKQLSKIAGPHPANHGSMAYIRKDIQIGQETNWLGLACYNEFAVTLKADGTLWRWSFFTQRGHYGFVSLGDPSTSRIHPVSFSSHSDWLAVGQMMGGIVSLAADGSLYLWRFQPEIAYYYGDSGWSPLLQVSRRPILLGNVFDDSN